jgi:hypothetical protein
MAEAAPPVYDPPEGLIEKTRALVRHYLGGPSDPGDPVPGEPIVRIVARLAEVAADRVNAVPDKNFFAFLDLLGVSLKPPQPARVPLTFELATGTTVDALVPAGTQVAALPEPGDTGPVVFETERDLVVMPVRLEYVFVREPARDLYSNHTDAVAVDGGFDSFAGDRPLAHRLYVGHEILGDGAPKQINLALRTATGAVPDLRWVRALRWSYWDGTTWVPAPLVPSLSDDEAIVMFVGVPRIVPLPIGDRTSSWLRGELTTTVPRRGLTVAAHGLELAPAGLPPDGAFVGTRPVRLDRPFDPFGVGTAPEVFYLAAEEIFSKPGARIMLTATLDASRPPNPSPDVEVEWGYSRSDPADPWGVLDVATVSGPRVGTIDDETDAFSKSGTVAFAAPSDWDVQPVGQAARRWLRLRVIAGDYGGSPPLLDGLELAYTWGIDAIESIDPTVLVNESGLSVDRAFTNQAALDVTKDFFPFGEHPRLNDTLYLASDAAFSVPTGTTVALSVTLTNPSNATGSPPPANPSSDLELLWERWDAQAGRWTTLGESTSKDTTSGKPDFVDGTLAFTKDGAVTIKMPAGSGPVEVNGQLGHWLRVRIVSGNYGGEAVYTPVNPSDLNQGYKLSKPTLAPPSVKGVTLSYSFQYPQPTVDIVTENDFAFADRTGATARWIPFLPTADVDPALYLGFDRPFPNLTTNLYLGLAEPLASTESAQAGAGEPPTVVWEYWNGAEWNRLETRDETRGLTRAGLLTFVGPADLLQSTDFDRSAYWLRGRFAGGEYAVSPEVERILRNTIWAEQATTLTDEVIGSSTGEPGQRFSLAKAPVLPGQRIEVREAALPAAADLVALIREEGTDVTEAAGSLSEVWVRWHEVTDFNSSGPTSRHYTLDRLKGEVGFGDGRHGLIPPVGRASIRASRYRTGGGPQGNRAAGSIAQLKTSVPYIKAVRNLEASGGGSSAESLDELRIRGPRTVRHRDRAVATVDYEDLVHEASSGVARVLVLPARGPASAGRVGLVIVPAGPAAKPGPSLELIARVQEYIEERLPATAVLEIGGPGWIRVDVEAEVVPVSLDVAADVESAVLARLAAFLHPLTGGLEANGWPFGRRPHRSDLHKIVEETPGVDHVRWLRTTEVDPEPGPAPDAFLVYSGMHTIRIVGGEGVSS